MDRLPERFEWEVLEKGSVINDGIYWEPEYGWYANDGVQVSWHDVAGRGLESMGVSGKRVSVMTFGVMAEGGIVGWVFNNNEIQVMDPDFCRCIFKAIREVYK